MGLVPGLKGAAEYQAMMKEGGLKYTDSALTGMDVQSIEHIIIILFSIMGNVGFFAEKRRLKAERGGVA